MPIGVIAKVGWLISASPLAAAAEVSGGPDELGEGLLRLPSTHCWNLDSISVKNTLVRRWNCAALSLIRSPC